MDENVSIDGDALMRRVGKRYGLIMTIEQFTERMASEGLARQLEPDATEMTLTLDVLLKDGVWQGICRETGTVAVAETREDIVAELADLVTQHLRSLANREKKR